MAPSDVLSGWPTPRAAQEAAVRELAPLWSASGTGKADRAAQLRTFFDPRSGLVEGRSIKPGPTFFDFQEAAGQVGGDLTDAMGAGAAAAAPAVGNAAQDAASSAAGAVMSGAQAMAHTKSKLSRFLFIMSRGVQAAAPMVGDAASALAGSVGDAANSLGAYFPEVSRMMLHACADGCVGDSASDGNCFPVFEKRRGIALMADVRIGDWLASAGGGFSEVIAFLHLDPGPSMHQLASERTTGEICSERGSV
ncbi:dhh-b [Symbiodinium natans]|uniref:Dhh-b protein n=1 Tax=Symbiodinium natans TaxID=878477 RepID=A0A812SJ73_9DINO|nr:dhh-b [Symbiodinium natans]